FHEQGDGEGARAVGEAAGVAGLAVGARARRRSPGDRTPGARAGGGGEDGHERCGEPGHSSASQESHRSSSRRPSPYDRVTNTDRPASANPRASRGGAAPVVFISNVTLPR